jgi:hypothetical protein
MGTELVLTEEEEASEEEGQQKLIEQWTSFHLTLHAHQYYIACKITNPGNDQN